jgi:hypothetical protein
VFFDNPYSPESATHEYWNRLIRDIQRRKPMKAVISACAAIALLAGCNSAMAETPATVSVKTQHDLSGVWKAMNRAQYDLEAHHARHALQTRQGPYGPVPAKSVIALGAVGAVPAGISVVKSGEIPYKPEALKVRDDNRANWVDRDPEIKCYLPGVPRANYMDLPFRIIQNEASMLIAYEYAGAVRNIFMEDPGEAPVDSWMGQSYGHWDGDTFVIEVTAQNGETWLDRAGNYLPYGAKVTERYTMMDSDHIRYEATIEEPDTYTAPWTISMVLYRLVEEDNQTLEFNCIEFVEELLHGSLRKEPLK